MTAFVAAHPDPDALRDEAEAESGICPPEVSTADEVRWAFMRRVHQDYAARVRMSAADALPETLKSAFRCG